MRRKWDTAHENLRRLYGQRIEPHMSQKEFGRAVGVSQGMVAMILSGERPLPLDLAPAFARELRCTIYDICPEMGDYIKDELLPVLGKALRRAAVVLLSMASLFVSAPHDARAQFDINRFAVAFVSKLHDFNTHCAAFVRMAKDTFVRFLTIFSLSCVNVNCALRRG